MSSFHRRAMAQVPVAPAGIGITEVASCRSVTDITAEEVLRWRGRSPLCADWFEQFPAGQQQHAPQSRVSGK